MNRRKLNEKNRNELLWPYEEGLALFFILTLNHNGEITYEWTQK